MFSHSMVRALTVKSMTMRRERSSEMKRVQAPATHRAPTRAYALKWWRECVLRLAEACSARLVDRNYSTGDRTSQTLVAPIVRKVPLLLRSFHREHVNVERKALRFAGAVFPASLAISSSLGLQAARQGHFYHPEIDVLRFLAFSGVFAHHALPQTPESYRMLPPEVANWVVATVYACGWGVDLFFALSSYLITELLIREQLRAQYIDVRSFYIRRALRIWPLYYSFLSFTLLAVPKLIPSEHLSVPHRIGFTFFGANWTVARYGWPPSVASPLWSVSIEEQFYLVWPVVIKYVGIQYISHVAVAMVMTALLVRVTLVQAGVAHPGIYANGLARLDPIAAGALLAVALHGNSPHIAASQRILLILLAITTLVVVTRYGALDGRRSLVSYPVVTLSSILIIYAFLHDETAVPAWLRNKLLIQLGRMSYGLYVFHQFSLAYVRPFVGSIDRPAKLAAYMGSGLGLTTLLAVISYRWIERPFLALKERFTVVRSRPA